MLTALIHLTSSICDCDIFEIFIFNCLNTRKLIKDHGSTLQSRTLTQNTINLRDFLPATWHWGAAWRRLGELQPPCCWRRCWAGHGQRRRMAWPALAPPPCRQNTGSHQGLCGRSGCWRVARQARTAHTANAAGAPSRAVAPLCSWALGVTSHSSSVGLDPLLPLRRLAGEEERVE